MRIFNLTALFVSALSFIAFAAPVAYGGDGLYSVRDCSIESRTCRLYPAAYQSVRDIDFRNFPLHLLEEQNKQLQLSNGYYADDVTRVDLKEVHYLSPSPAGAEHVLLVLSAERTGSTPRAEWIAQVQQFSKQQWTVVQEFSADLEKPDHPAFSYAFDDSTKTLALRFDRLADEHECGASTGSCAVNYRWSGSRFVHPLPQ